MAERELRLMRLAVHVPMVKCGACGIVESSTLLAVQQKRRAVLNHYMTPPDVPDDAFVATCSTLPNGWERIDPLHDSPFKDQLNYCPNCHPRIVEAMEAARLRAIQEIVTARGGKEE